MTATHSIAFRRVQEPAFVVDEEHPICKQVAKSHEEAAAGTPFAGRPQVAGFYAVCDAAFLNPQGVPSIVYGPGSLLVAHAADEYIDIEELMVATKTYTLTIAPHNRVANVHTSAV